MNKEELMLRKRLIELSNQAYSRDIVTFSDFLNLNELHILHTTPKDMSFPHDGISPPTGSLYHSSNSNPIQNLHEL